MRSKPSRNESKWIASSASLDWIHICCAVAVRGKWRMQMAELSKAIKETCRARRRPPKRDLKSFSSFMTRSRLRHNKPIYGNMHTLYMARYTIHIYIYIGYIHIGQHTLQSYREARLEIAFWFAIKKDGSTLGS